ncbi:Xaa-Pro peptidase family protein [Tessaracoccus lubricantis]|uniref:Xaa-Pro peptidase family protein n=1 Tax=Tessaracoccus lubricantis TaxID=545543 RepID=A0ABP9FMT1_9ACTN|nr:M24 family metallopeptidase [Tessaracoccus sp. MC1865]
MERIRIPASEYADRAKRAGELMRERNLDALLLYGNEADYANARYFSGFWPVFERAGVAINPDGKTALLVGPESDIFAKDTAAIQDIFVLAEYREAADPAYPHLSLQTFQDVFGHLGISGQQLRIGVCSILDTNVVVWNSLQSNFPGAELVDARDIMVELRSVKSDAEVACLREAGRITDLAVQDVIAAIRPGMTELQLVGVAQKSMYENGAEYEGLPQYCFAEESTKHAISRSGYRVLKPGDIIQLNLSAAVDGYSPAIGLPVSLGPLKGEKKDIVDFILEMHMWTEREFAAGRVAGEIARDYEQKFLDAGRKDAYVYGPAHGLGLTEVEAPWMETSSEYTLKPNMTFQLDTFGIGSNFGVRWEKPVVVREGGVDFLANQIGTIYEVGI